MSWLSTKYSTININSVQRFSIDISDYPIKKEPYKLRACFSQDNYEDIGSYSTIDEAIKAKAELDKKLRLNCGGVFQ